MIVFNGVLENFSPPWRRDKPSRRQAVVEGDLAAGGVGAVPGRRPIPVHDLQEVHIVFFIVFFSVFVIFSVFKGVLVLYSVFNGVVVLYTIFKCVLVLYSVCKGVLVLYNVFKGVLVLYSVFISVRRTSCLEGATDLAVTDA